MLRYWEAQPTDSHQLTPAIVADRQPYAETKSASEPTLFRGLQRAVRRKRFRMQVVEFLPGTPIGANQARRVLREASGFSKKWQSCRNY
jgi:hypothetical protein